MLKSELHQLEKIVRGIVNSNETDGHGLQAQGADLFALLAEACNDLKKKWVQELFSTVKEPVLMRYVQFHQAGIITLSDQMSIHAPDGHPWTFNAQTADFRLQVVDYLEDLLEFLEKRFYKFFDFDHVLSAYRFVKEKNNIKGLLATVSAKLTELNINQALVETIQNAVNRKLEGGRQDSISYHHVVYLKGFLQLLEEQAENSGLDTKGVEELLYRHNFNSQYFEQYYQDSLAAAVEMLPVKKRRGHIDGERQILATRFPDHNRKFENELASIEQMLLALPMLRPAGHRQGDDRAASRQPGHSRMPLNLSVGQFALFIRLCYLEGCLHVNNISDILRFFTFHFETKKQLNISVNSFRRAFYGADQANAAIIRDFLQRMLEYLDKTYFPKT